MQSDNMLPDEPPTEPRKPEPIGLDLSDLADLAERETSALVQPVKQPPARFAATIAAAAKANAPRLAATESRIVAAQITDALAPAADRLLADAAKQSNLLEGYGIKVRATAHRIAPPGFYKEPARIVTGWLELPHKLLLRPGKEIVQSLREKYPAYGIPDNFMSRKLHRWQSKHVRSLMRRFGVLAEAKHCRSLSAINKRLIDHFNPPEYDVYRPVIKIARDGSHLLWDGQRFKIFLNKSTPSIKRNGKTLAVSTVVRVVGE